MINNGYYKDKTYIHTPKSEHQLFIDTLNEYSKNRDKKIIGVEVGVLEGKRSQLFLSINNKINIIGIDPIIPDSMNPNLIGNINEINRRTSQYGDRYKFIKDYSHNVVNDIPSNIDFIFIDASHHYEDVKKDYEMFIDKIKKNGLIYFHDSRMNRGGANFHVGPSKLVDELIVNNKNIDLIGEAYSLTCFIKK